MGIWNFEGKRVVVSGCFSGMGYAAAKELVALGAEVHGLDYKQTDLNLASFTQIDLRDPASIDSVAGKIDGKIDCLFNCAGLSQAFPALDVMKVNWLGMRRLTDSLVPMINKGGAIATISSNAGLGWSQRMPQLFEILGITDWDQAVAHFQSLPEESIGYTLSKELIAVWTMQMCVPMIERGIRINCTMPGPTQTPMMKEFEEHTPAGVLDAAAKPINRRSTPEEQAYPLIFLNSDAASYVNGAVLPIDGGFMGAITTGQINLWELTGGEG